MLRRTKVKVTHAGLHLLIKHNVSKTFNFLMLCRKMSPSCTTSSGASRVSNLFTSLLQRYDPKSENFEQVNKLAKCCETATRYQQDRHSSFTRLFCSGNESIFLLKVEVEQNTISLLGQKSASPSGNLWKTISDSVVDKYSEDLNYQGGSEHYPLKYVKQLSQHQSSYFTQYIYWLMLTCIFLIVHGGNSIESY